MSRNNVKAGVFCRVQSHDPNLGKVRVAAFTGRESDAPFGIWGVIAEQIGKK
jgi:hypothetical protein